VLDFVIILQKKFCAIYVFTSRPYVTSSIDDVALH